MLGRFLDLARLEEDNTVLSLTRIDLAELIRTTLLDFYPDFMERSITPAVLMPDKSMYVNGNADALRRMLDNLIANALRYGADGKEIGVGVREEAQFAVVDIWDTGKGISAEDLPHIFERLYTSELSRNTSLRGTGLGLTIAKTLIEKQGGTITAASIPGEKTVFSFSLPMDKSDLRNL
jgi:signal transduction histidine kinase